MFTGADQLLPSSSLLNSQTVRPPFDFFAVISFSVALPGLCVANSQMTPVSSSRTGQGFPQVFVLSFQSTCCSPQVLPPSPEHLSNKSISPESEPLFFRPSQKAKTVPFFVTISDGIRYV